MASESSQLRVRVAQVREGVAQLKGFGVEAAEGKVLERSGEAGGRDGKGGGGHCW